MHDIQRTLCTVVQCNCTLHNVHYALQYTLWVLYIAVGSCSIIVGRHDNLPCDASFKSLQGLAVRVSFYSFKCYCKLLIITLLIKKYVLKFVCAQFVLCLCLKRVPRNDLYQLIQSAFLSTCAGKIVYIYSGVARVPAARADLKFAAPWDIFCLIPQNFLTTFFVFADPPKNFLPP